MDSPLLTVYWYHKTREIVIFGKLFLYIKQSASVTKGNGNSKTKRSESGISPFYSPLPQGG